MNAFQKMKLNGLRKKIRKIHEQRANGKEVPKEDEIKLLLELGQFYDEHIYDEELPKSEVYALESFRRAAVLGDSQAQFICGKRFLDRARFWEKFSKDIYGDPIHQKYFKDSYEEAFRFLQMAEDQQHPLAQRLHGLAYLKAWGVTKDMERGFNLVVASIETEKSWDRAPQIFKDLGLNSPEFFTLLVSQRSGAKPTIDVSKLEVKDDEPEKEEDED